MHIVCVITDLYADKVGLGNVAVGGHVGKTGWFLETARLCLVLKTEGEKKTVRRGWGLPGYYS